MNYIICVAAAVGSFFLAWRTLDLKTVRSSRLLRSRHPEDEEMGKQLGPQQILALALLLTLADTVTVWRLFLTVHDPLNLLKLSLALVILTGCACVDGVEHRIPNFLSGTLALSALALLAAEFYGHPAEKLTLVGITGTKGKTHGRRHHCRRNHFFRHAPLRAGLRRIADYEEKNHEGGHPLRTLPSDRIYADDMDTEILIG